MSKEIDYTVTEAPRLKNLCSNNNIDICIVQISLSGTPCHIISLYSPPNSSDTQSHPNLWSEFFTHCEELTSPIICGDFNGRHPLWCTTHSVPYRTGSLIADALMLSDLFILNDGSATWASADRSSMSSPDLTMISPVLAPLSDWQVLGCNHGSDHFPIITQIRSVSPGKMVCRPHYSTARVE